MSESSTSTGFSGGSGYGEESGASLTDQAKQTVQNTAQQAKEQGGHLLEQAKEQLRGKVTDGKEQAAGSLESVAVALRETGDSLRSQDQSPFAGLLDTAAGAVENVSNYLRDHEMEDFAREAEDFGRRQPALFLGAAFAIGFAAARFIKSSSPGGSRSTRSNGDAYSSTYGSTYGSAYSGSPVGSDVDTSLAVSSYGMGSEAARSDLTGTETGLYTGVGFDDADELADADAARIIRP